MNKVKIVNNKNDGICENTIKLEIEFVYNFIENSVDDIINELKEVVQKYSL